jgi:L-ascorbate metabolism protein UlaG (beta-lactamase superfamily)
VADRAYVGMGLTTKRLTEPALSIQQLPELDFIVLSHHHGDHFDRIAARDLDHNVPVITEPRAARKLRRQGFRAPIALSTWQSQVVSRTDAEVRVTSLPGKHAPRPLGHLVPPVMGSLLDFSRSGRRLLRMYVTGDTLMHGGIGAIAGRFPGIDLCLIHLGGTRIAGTLLTMDARQGVEALRIIAPREAIPLHYDDYTLFKSPLSEFRQAAAHAGVGTTVHYLDRAQATGSASAYPAAESRGCFRQRPGLDNPPITAPPGGLSARSVALSRLNSGHRHARSSATL